MTYEATDWNDNKKKLDECERRFGTCKMPLGMMPIYQLLGLTDEEGKEIYKEAYEMAMQSSDEVAAWLKAEAAKMTHEEKVRFYQATELTAELYVRKCRR